jgi:hypothetical protein
VISDSDIRQSKLTCVKCGYNLTGTAVGGYCPECGMLIEKSLERFGATRPTHFLPYVSYVIPVLFTVCLCPVGGIASIFYTTKANEAAALGRPERYWAARKRRDTWMAASIVLGVVLYVMFLAGLLG